MPDHELSVSLELEAKNMFLRWNRCNYRLPFTRSNNEKLDQINLILSTTTKNIISEHAELLKTAKLNLGCLMLTQ